MQRMIKKCYPPVNYTAVDHGFFSFVAAVESNFILFHRFQPDRSLHVSMCMFCGVTLLHYSLIL